MAGQGTVTVTTAALHTDLTTVGAVKEHLGVAVDGQDGFLGRLVTRASDRILRYCARSFAREFYSETFAGFGAVTVMLARTPLVSVTAVTYLSTPVTDYAVQDATAGFLFRERGWDWSRGVGWALVDFTLPDGERPSFAATYWGGYLLPSDDVVSAGLSVDGPTQTFTLASGSTMPLVTAGDVLTASGFTNAANNGRMTVVSRTASTIVVTASPVLVTEAATPDLRTLAVSTLPGDVEEAAIETAKTWFQNRAQNAAVTSKRIGDLSLTYADPTMATELPLPAKALLAPWRRWEVAA